MSQTSQQPGQGRSEQDSPKANVPDIDLTSVDHLDPGAEEITIREAIERGLVGPTEVAVRKRIQRSGEDGPALAGKRGNANVYRVDDLIEWSESTSERGKN